jgi:hypothetical protein
MGYSSVLNHSFLQRNPPERLSALFDEFTDAQWRSAGQRLDHEGWCGRLSDEATRRLADAPPFSSWALGVGVTLRL